VKAYNLCDREHSISQIANAIKVKRGTLSPILSEWENLSIIYEVIKKGGRFYNKLYRLEMPKPAEVPKKEKPKTESVEITEEKSIVQEPEVKQELTT